MTTITGLAVEAAGCFEVRYRAGGGEFVARKNDAPEWISELCRSAHGDMLPDDWRYSCIRDALEFISDELEDSEDLDELRHLFADDVDILNIALLEWLKSHSARIAYCDQAKEEMGEHDGSIMAAIARGQYMERLEVVGLVLEALQLKADS